MIGIEVKNADLGYEKQVVVSDLSFRISEGDYLCIIGENGSGKTTLMKTLLSLNEPLKGSIVFSGGLKKNEVGYLPQQNSAHREFPSTVFEIVMSGFASRNGMRPFYSSSQKAQAMENMKRMGIADLSLSSFSKLSGGQQQRVLLARALCAADKVLLLDEPVAGLDSASSQMMYQLIRELHKDGTTIIMITHDLEDVLDDATHILHIGKHNSFYDKKTYLKKMREDYHA
jgi:zinc transport system ATP-binding protein